VVLALNVNRHSTAEIVSVFGRQRIVLVQPMTIARFLKCAFLVWFHISTLISVGKCISPGWRSEKCDSTHICRPELSCINDICQGNSTEGENCTTTDDCRIGLYCNTTLGVCVRKMSEFFDLTPKLTKPEANLVFTTNAMASVLQNGMDRNKSVSM
jgi:hypothetical protein